ncbi:MAG: Npt1/Npt2 family nucleotide transporter [Acidobacteriota bacterium]|nr:Npt1/Npt2 family nucleotide transporter [Acidobacteriota bacterium]
MTNPLYRLLRLNWDIRPGEGAKAFWLGLNIFVLLFAYYILKPIREALILTGQDPQTKSYLGALQAVLIIFVIKAFSRLASKVPRHVLITWVTLFFISNLVLFYALHLAGLSRGTMSIVFFLWVGIFNLMVVAQFWSFANDLYGEADGKRLFPLIALGGNLGAFFGGKLAKRLFAPLGSFNMMLVVAALLGVCILLVWTVHRREVRLAASGTAEGKAAAGEAERPLKAGGGFQLIFRKRYLLYIALLIGVYNFINANGEYMFSSLQTKTAERAIASGTAGGLSLEAYIGRAFADYQSLAALLTILIQLFLVSRIFRWVGIGGALLVLPIFVLGGYGYTAFGASLIVLKWIKAAENGTDYSLMNTTKAALFLRTSREEKYKAKVAIDTFFQRGGDTLSALAVFVGSSWLAMKLEGLAIVNLAAIVIWIALAILIAREFRRNGSGGGSEAKAKN